MVKSKDLRKLSADVREFLNKTSVESRFGTMATLTLEFPSIQSLHEFMIDLSAALTPSMKYSNDGPPWKEIQNGIYELTFGGMRIMLIHLEGFKASTY